MHLTRLSTPVMVAAAGVSCAHRGPVALQTPASVQRQVINAVDAGDGDYQVRILRAMVDADPRDLKARLELAARYQQLGFPEVALEHCRLACERAPESEEAQVALARMLRDQNRAAEGARTLSDFAARHESGAQVWAWIGLLRDDAGDWKSGEAAHRKALALAPERDDLHNNLGYCLLREGRKTEAIAEFEAALRVNAHSAIAQNNLGMALAGSSKEAVEHLQSVTDAASAHNNLAVAYIEAGRYSDARREIDLALGYNRQHSAALMNLELISRLDGKPAEVEALVRTEGKWARAKTAWLHFWGSDAPVVRSSNQQGSAVASR